MKKKKIKKAPFIILLLLIVGIFGSLYLFRGYFLKEKEDTNADILEKENPKDKVYSTTFTLGGNVLINSNMWYDTKTSDGYDFDKVFSDLNDIMKKSDVNFYFEQSIVAGAEAGTSYNYSYNTPEDTIKSLSKLGFNAMSLGSYHAYDKGLAGIKSTIETISNNKYIYAGVNDSEENRLKNNIIEKNGIKIALLSYTTATDEIVQNAFAVDIYSDELVKSDVEGIKDLVDVIMVSIDYSGGNVLDAYDKQTVSEEQKRIATYLSGLGVDIVVGNTGYTIQPIEMINNTLVCYSLGNLLSGHYAIDSRVSAMVDFDLKITKSNTEKKVSFENISVLFTYAYNNNSTDYKVIPFTKLTNELVNYKSYYEKYKTLLSSNDLKINFYSIGD